MLLGIAAVLVLILSAVGVFSNDAQNAGEALQLQLDNAQLQLEQHIESLEANSIALSEQISRTLETLLTGNGVTITTITRSPGCSISTSCSGREKTSTLIYCAAKATST